MSTQPERCDLCGVDVPADHRHLVELDERRILCACRPCSILFDRRGAGKGRFRLVPERVLIDATGAVPLEVWDRLELPVGVVFVFTSSALDRPVACFPGPAGVTESTLSLDAWTDVLETYPLAGMLEPDVEALLFHRERDAAAAECFLAPIDACYELAGRLRLVWHGFDGGDEARAAIETYFAGLCARAKVAAVQS